MNSLFDAFKSVQCGDLSVTGFSRVGWEADDIRVALLDHGVDTPNPTTDQDLADIASGARIAVSASSIASKTAIISAGTMFHSGANVTLPLVTGASAESILIYGHTGVEATSLLIVMFDSGVTGLPVTPNGGDITINWNPSGIWTW